MFLDSVITRNWALVEAAVDLHHHALLEPDTFILDLDAIEHNASVLASASRLANIGLWFVQKQYGRNPLISTTVASHIPRAAAIDYREAMQFNKLGIKLGNVGHLVQIPKRYLADLVRNGHPDYVTAFSMDYVDLVNSVAAEVGVRQNILLRMEGAPDGTFPGQHGGFTLRDIETLVSVCARRYKNVQIAGVTGFPCVAYNSKTEQPGLTPTGAIVLQATNVLKDNGIDAVSSLPSHTSVASLDILSQVGASFGEPGHSLTGTTPHHAVDLTQPELPAIVYLSEVATVGRMPSLYGGGFYARGNIGSSLIFHKGGHYRCKLKFQESEYIDYYRELDESTRCSSLALGDTAIMSFRTQVFVLRSNVAVVSGISSSKPKLEGVWSPIGQRIK